DEALIRPVVAECLPAANGRLVQAKICLYTVIPDGDFLLDSLPGAPQILVASPCSGHGFKFAPVIGEILADLATAGTTAHDISRFRPARFGGERLARSNDFTGCLGPPIATSAPRVPPSPQRGEGGVRGKGHCLIRYVVIPSPDSLRPSTSPRRGARLRRS